MISRHEASVGQAPVERERNLMRPDGEREREGEGGRRGEKCTRPNRAGYRCISDDAFQEFRARSTLEEFFFPSFPPSATSAASPHSSRSLARSLARQASDPTKTMFPLLIDGHHYYATLPCESTRSTLEPIILFYSRFFSLLGKREDDLSERRWLMKDSKRVEMDKIMFFFRF